MCIAVRQMPAGSVDNSVSHDGNIFTMFCIDTSGNNSTFLDIDRIIWFQGKNSYIVCLTFFKTNSGIFRFFDSARTKYKQGVMKTTVCLYCEFSRFIEMNMNGLSFYGRFYSETGGPDGQFFKRCMDGNFQIICLIVYYYHIIEWICMVYHTFCSVADYTVFFWFLQFIYRI